VGFGLATWSSGEGGPWPVAWQLDDGKVRPGGTRGLHGGRRWEEGMVGSLRKRLDVRGQSGGGVRVLRGR
jgi:hypothetical protein